MNDVVALGLILLLSIAGYTAGRFHGQLGYKLGYRYGYRQGYFDGDRASWNRRRRDLQAAVASVLTSSGASVGTTYTSAASDDAVTGDVRPDAAGPDAVGPDAVGLDAVGLDAVGPGQIDDEEVATRGIPEPRGRHAKVDRANDPYRPGRRTEIRQRSLGTLNANSETGDR